MLGKTAVEVCSDFSLFEDGVLTDHMKESFDAGAK